MGHVTGTDDQLLQVAQLAHRLDVLVNVGIGGEHVALDLTLVRATQYPEATILAPPSAPRVDGDLRREGESKWKQLATGSDHAGTTLTASANLPNT